MHIYTYICACVLYSWQIYVTGHTDKLSQMQVDTEQTEHLFVRTCLHALKETCVHVCMFCLHN